MKQRTIRCDKCNATATYGLKWIGKGMSRVKCWDIPEGWKVTLPNGWLCPKCSKSEEAKKWVLYRTQMMLN